ncbi:MAG: phospholipase C [Acidimicrobiales bacterium]
MADDVSRRSFLAGLGAVSGGLVLAGRPGGPRGHGRGQPGDRPNHLLPEGVDLLPEIEHIVIYMQENHSYDSYFGMHRRGDGYTRVDGIPQNSVPDLNGDPFAVFHAPDTCQSGQGVSQNWVSTHEQIDGGKMDGFLFNGNTNAMRYWDGTDLPFYYSLAQTFPLCDRWFASAPAQTYPNRLYLQAGTCQDLISTDVSKILTMPHPAGGTIWDKLNAFGISWTDYAWDLPDIALFQHTYAANASHVKNFPQFLSDCRTGSLPSVSIVSPGVSSYTEENPSDVQLGEAYSSSIVNALMHGPGWPKTVLLFMYDEHGGYYDHVAPPAAVPPDDIPPAVAPTPDVPAAWDHYGLRVPAFVISPFSKHRFVSHKVHDHTSVLRFIETKFNLGALTRRDANATNLLDCLDFSRPPAFLEPPVLAAPGLPATGSLCTPAIPPPPTEPPAGGGASSGPSATLASAGPPVGGPPLSDSQRDRLALLDHIRGQAR